jgi:hypothetical protein
MMMITRMTRSHEQGTLALPTGRLIVGDPGELFGDAKPLGLALPPGDYPVSAGADGFEVTIAGAEPVRWTDAAPGFDTPSGYVCLLDAAALEEFTDLGDEPVDEYELLTERLRAHPGEPIEFAGLLVLPAAHRVRTLRAGFDGADRLTRLVASY